eukprot:jgi/Ulvmu1/815/UM010_0189.1
MRTSAAEKLAELATPAPVADPEAADALDDGPGLFDSDEELPAAGARPGWHAPEKRRRHAAIDVDSQIYRGRKASRKDVFADDLPSASNSSGEDSDMAASPVQQHQATGRPGTGTKGGAAKNGKHNQTQPSRQRSLAEIGEDEWGDEGDGTASEGDMPGRMASDSSGSDDADDSGGGEGGSTDNERDNEQVVLHQAPTKGRTGGRAAKGPQLAKGGTGPNADDSDTSSEEEGGSEGSMEEDSNAGSESDEEEDGLGVDMGEGESSIDEDDDGEDTEGWEQLEADFATIQAAPSTAKAPSTATAQAAKAASVATQVKLWEQVLGVRITLQRGLVAADRLPRGAAYVESVATTDGTQQRIDAAKHEAAAVLGDCMDAMHQLISRTAEGSDAGAAEGPGPGAQATRLAELADGNACEGIWPLIQGLEARFAPFRDEEVDRWHRRTLLASGQVAMKGAAGLRALNQPLSHQVAEVMRNPDRALARTRRRRQAHDRVLCEPLGAGAAAPDDALETASGWTDADADVLGEAGQRRGTQADAESYDDSSFYQLLLQEFLEAAESDGRVSGVAQVPKNRRTVDRRASKGRKVRYHVMPKLVNFMVPVEDKFTEADDRISALFTNLFGHKTRL